MSTEKPDSKLTQFGWNPDEKPQRVTQGYSMREPIDMCEGHQEELDHIMTRLVGKNEIALSESERDKLVERAELLNRQLDERNDRLDNSGGIRWR
jgi:hypothetical protein